MATEIEVAGQRIFVEDVGQGTPVILLHSSGLSSQQWRRLREALAPTHRVLAPDLVAYGRSGPWAGSEPFQYQTDVAVAEAVAALAAAPVHLVGHSYGGLIALKAALGGKFSVKTLSLFDPVAFGVLYSSGDAEGLANLSAASADPRFSDRALAGTVEWAELFVDFWNGRGYWARLSEGQRKAFLSSGRKMTEEVLSLSFDRTTHQEYARIVAPTLLLTGSASPAAGFRTASVLAKALPQAQLVTVEGAGHMGPLTHADQVNALIAGHIRAVEAQ